MMTKTSILVTMVTAIVERIKDQLVPELQILALEEFANVEQEMLVLQRTLIHVPQTLSLGMIFVPAEEIQNVVDNQTHVLKVRKYW